MLNEETKIILKKGYAAGRFFGLIWALVFFVAFFVSLSELAPLFQYDPYLITIFIIPMIGILILLSEILGPAIGIFSVSINHFLNKQLSNNRKTIFWKLLISGIVFSFLSFPIFGFIDEIIETTGYFSNDSQERSDLRDIINIMKYFIIPLFVAIVFFFLEHKITKREIKIHSIVRVITVFSFCIYIIMTPLLEIDPNNCTITDIELMLSEKRPIDHDNLWLSEYQRPIEYKENIIETNCYPINFINYVQSFGNIPIEAIIFDISHNYFAEHSFEVDNPYGVSDAFTKKYHIRDIEFNTNGTNLSVIVKQETVSNYSCDVPFEISSCTFTDSYDISEQEVNPKGLYPDIYLEISIIHLIWLIFGLIFMPMFIVLYKFRHGFFTYPLQD